MDMVFRDDECRVRVDNGPENFATVKHMASNLLRTETSKISLKQKRLKAAWNDEYLFNVITQ